MCCKQVGPTSLYYTREGLKSVSFGVPSTNTVDMVYTVYTVDMV